MLEDGLSAGILSVGGNVVKVGVMPTPAVAYLVREMQADCGVVISASHNPYEYNGIKFFNGSGFKLDDAIEEDIEAIANGENGEDFGCSGHKIGRMLEQTDVALHSYVDYLIDGVNEDLSGMKIVVDCANGAAYLAAERVFEELGAETILMGNEPDGLNINDHVGSTHPGALRERVLKESADLGLAFDGDADRLIAVDGKGRIVDGDAMLYVCAKDMKEQGLLDNNTVTATVMSNIGLRLALEKEEIDLQIADVGDRYVLELMQRTGCILGGEQSGHIIFLDKNTTGDGLYAALRLLEAIKRSKMSLSELADGIHIYPQVLKNARVKNENKSTYLSDPEIRIAIEKIEKQLHGEGRILIRASGTEPLVRVMLEGDDQEYLDDTAGELADLIEKKLG
jgi:phosphoglucosamine mutase